MKEYYASLDESKMPVRGSTVGAEATQQTPQPQAMDEAYDSDATISVLSEEEDAKAVDKCAFQEHCNLNSPVRRVISHYFGRNKKETRAIPDYVWVNYCRQHYQRAKYRQKPEIYAQTQMRLVKATVRNLEAWGGVTDFEIDLRKRAKQSIVREDAANAATDKKRGESSRSKIVTYHAKERWMVRYCGKGKSYDDVYDLIDAIVEHCNKYSAPCPEFELVPNIKPHLMGRREAAHPPKKLSKQTARSAKPTGVAKRVPVSTIPTAGPVRRSLASAHGK